MDQHLLKKEYFLKHISNDDENATLYIYWCDEKSAYAIEIFYDNICFVKRREIKFDVKDFKQLFEDFHITTDILSDLFFVIINIENKELFSFLLVKNNDTIKYLNHTYCKINEDLGLMKCLFGYYQIHNFSDEFIRQEAVRCLKCIYPRDNSEIVDLLIDLCGYETYDGFYEDVLLFHQINIAEYILSHQYLFFDLTDPIKEKLTEMAFEGKVFYISSDKKTVCSSEV